MSQDVEEVFVGKKSQATSRPTWFWQPGNAKQEETMINIDEEELTEPRADGVNTATPSGHTWNQNYSVSQYKFESEPESELKS